MSSYDENLLRSAPTATKAQIQDGYDPALLEGKHTPSGSTTHLPPDLEPGRGTPNRSPIQQAPGQIPFSPEKPLPVQRKQPFYRTSKGIIIIIVVALVVIGAVVGGAVGGTQKKNKNLEVAPGSAQASSTQASSGDQSQGTGPQNSNDTSSVSHISQQTFGPSSTIAGQDTQNTSTNADDAASDPLATPTRTHAIPSNTLSDLSPGQITPPVQPPGTQGDGNGAAGSSPFGTGGGNLAGAFGSFP